MKKLKVLFRGDIYQGIGYICDEINTEHLGYYENKKEIKTFLDLFVDKYEHRDLLSVYCKLYPFNVNTKSNYIRYTDIQELDYIVCDFERLCKSHYYKIPLNVLGVMIHYFIDIQDEFNSIDFILDKGYNVNSYIRIKGYRTTILHHAIRNDRFPIINSIIDKNPNLYIVDDHQDTAVSLFKQIDRQKYRGNRWMLNLFYKFYRLKNIQKNNPWN
jgi:hypothetical protein